MMIDSVQIRAALECQIDTNKLQTQGYDTVTLLDTQGKLITVVVIQSK